MKHSKFATGFLLATGLFLFIGAGTNSNTSAEIPRYHITWSGGDWGYAYDAVTGDCRRIKHGDAKNGNIKELLGRHVEE
jgi:hypothetical protein